MISDRSVESLAIAAANAAVHQTVSEASAASAQSLKSEDDTPEGRARKHAAALAMNSAVQQQVRRAMQVAAERVGAEETQQKVASQPLPTDPAQRRAALRERVRALE